MDIKVFPSAVSGSLRAPTSKSQSIRAIAAAMLANGSSQIYYPSACDDSVSMKNIAKSLGSEINEWPDRIEISPGFQLSNKAIACGESGLAARLMIAIAALSEKEIEITGEGTLLSRHLGNIIEPLTKLGVRCQSTKGKLPLHVQGPLMGGQVEVDGSGGSQFISGLLMALPLVKNNSTIIVHQLKSIPYIDMTLEMLDMFGVEIQHQDYQIFNIKGGQSYQAAKLEIEGDWSGAPFPLLAGALAGNVKVNGLIPSSRQADIKILEAFKLAGVKVLNNSSGFQIEKSQLKGFDFDATHCPDLFPPLAVMAAAAKGISRIAGVNRLSQKESDRGIVLKQGLAKLGIRIDLEGDVMLVHGGKIHGGVISSHNDHRIAMAGAIAALIADAPITIQNAECVSKSYPSFFEDLKNMGVRIYTFSAKD